MNTDVAKNLADNIVYGDTPGDVHPKLHDNSNKSLTKREGSKTSALSSYSMTTERSQMSGDVDRWMTAGSRSPSENAIRERANGDRTSTTAQRSTLATASSLNNANLWYILALIWPLFSMNGAYSMWSCTPSTIIATAEMFMTNLARVCGRAHAGLRRLAEEQVARDIFATLMDIVLVVYALGFLVLSLYQAQVFD